MKTYDLNLLRTLDALLAAGSVTGAAERLHLSVPATSHALARLRELTGDPLLVRAGRRLVPTPRAVALREPVAQWIAQAAALVQTPRGDDLAATERSFVVRAPDGFAIAFGAALGAALAADMPRAQLRFVTETQDDDGALRDGRVDLDIGTLRPREPEIEVVDLFPEALIAVVRAGHTFAARPATARRYAAQSHIDVQRRAGAPSAVDDALAALGLARRVVLTVAHASAAPVIAARGDFVATLSERLARAMAPGLGLALVPLPFLPRGETVVMSWHPRHAADPAHAWLRRQVPAAIAAAGAPLSYRMVSASST
ncbi:LysR family transcriptional regulator [Cupriavidus necator]|uniref:LysR family transcriptional regulator n=1 Tax=Cupriavidus necator TaxID=106590 RepID=A0A367P882_CUPNE|nr:LysR family transcriptional regulator [Cupriavidus necator]QQX87724.1 LysR family transcriptional regulator [Cupriavidus necator]RCJ04051.1 LysR family transcriptional regulator [Cupriavidus necator]